MDPTGALSCLTLLATETSKQSKLLAHSHAEQIQGEPADTISWVINATGSQKELRLEWKSLSLDIPDPRPGLGWGLPWAG